MTTTNIVPLAQDSTTRHADSAPSRAERAPGGTNLTDIFRSMLAGRTSSMAQQLPDRAPERAVTIGDRARQRQNVDHSSSESMTGTPSLASIARAELASPATPNTNAPTQAKSDSSSSRQPQTPGETARSGASASPKVSGTAPTEQQPSTLQNNTPQSDTTDPSVSATNTTPKPDSGNMASQSASIKNVAVSSPATPQIAGASAQSANAVDSSGESPEAAAPTSDSSGSSSRAIALAEKAFPETRISPETRADGSTSPRLTEDSEHAFASQLQRGLAAALNQNGGTVNIRLQPEALGDLKIRMDLRHGQVSAEFRVDSVDTKSILDQQLGALREALETRGLEVQNLAVHVADDAPKRNVDESPRESARSDPSNRQTAAGTPLALVVDADGRRGNGAGGGWGNQSQGGSGAFRQNADVESVGGTSTISAASSALADALGSRSDPHHQGGAQRNLGALTLRLDAIA